MTTDPRSQGDLLSAWCDGDAAAFDRLVSLYEARLLRHARSILGECAEYEDVVQEAFLRLAKAPPTLAATGEAEAEEAQLTSWLYKVTKNCCMDALRSNNRRKKREEEVALTEATSGGIARVEEDDTRMAVERGLQKLPLDQREVLALRLFGDRSYKEIAEITGKKIGTVGWLISVGLKALQGELASLLQPRAAGHDTTGDAQVGTLQGGM
ncbi:MAG: RNA polymerase sigma factor [Planctomycetota bacterium]